VRSHLDIAIQVSKRIFMSKRSRFDRAVGWLPLVRKSRPVAFFQFGPSRLWIDKAESESSRYLAGSETNDTERLASFLRIKTSQASYFAEWMRWHSCGKRLRWVFVAAPNGVSSSVVPPPPVTKEARGNRDEAHFRRH